MTLCSYFSHWLASQWSHNAVLCKMVLEQCEEFDSSESRQEGALEDPSDEF